MPKVLRRNLPPGLYAHLLERIHQREIRGKDLTAMINWLDTNPEVPQGKWFKRFPGMVVCGEGELVRTFLSADQTPVGDEVK